LLRKWITWFDSIQERIKPELTTRKPTVPMPLATPSDTRSMKLDPPAYGDGPDVLSW
jgi:hypothetical protein